MPYKLLLQYYASMYEYRYNITPISDYSKAFKSNVLKQYQDILLRFHGFNIPAELNNIIFTMLRDGIYVGFMYDSEEDGMFFMPLDVRYCRIVGKTAEGQWIVYFDANYFNQGNNIQFIEGVDGDTSMCWDPCFIDGYKQYDTQGRDYQWFLLTPELTACFIATTDDEFYMPLPYFLPIFKSLLQLLDTETLIANKNELQNYKLILEKIPLLDGDDIDDFAISLDLVMQFQSLLEQNVPDNVGVGVTPCETEVVSFEKSTSTADTDELGNAMNNLFSNAGVNRLIISSGESSNANGIKYSIANDLGKISVFVRKIESWLNYYIKKNIAEGFFIRIMDITRYNHQDFVNEMKDAATLGGSKMDYLIALGHEPLEIINKLKFESELLAISQYMEPLESSYNRTNDVGGGQVKPDEELSPEGQATRDSGKNEDKGNK